MVTAFLIDMINFGSVLAKLHELAGDDQPSSEVSVLPDGDSDNPAPVRIIQPKFWFRTQELADDFLEKVAVVFKSGEIVEITIMGKPYAEGRHWFVQLQISRYAAAKYA